MLDDLFIDDGWRGRKSTRFWGLLGLSAAIAAAGVVADSTATVIGAMIVAPLMIPILGSAFAFVLVDRTRLVRSVAFVLGGAALVIAVGVLFSLYIRPPDDFIANGQIDQRITPSLIDLVAALATGTVGAFALVRSDISDTLPGVAIAISLVPPLAVTGLLIGVERYGDAMGALLLFGTNVAAIIATGAIVFWIARVRDVAAEDGHTVGVFRLRNALTIAGFLFVIAVPLAIGSYHLTRDQQIEAAARPLARNWADGRNLLVLDVTTRNRRVLVNVIGEIDESDPDALRLLFDGAGLRDADLYVRLEAGEGVRCLATGDSCEPIYGMLPTGSAATPTG